MKRHGLHGFTIIELLVVIAILTVLAGIVFAATGPSREKARQRVCASNLRQIGQALAIYRSDYEGGSGTGSEMHKALAQFGLPPGRDNLLPYLSNNQEVFHCPNVSPEEAEKLRRMSASGEWSNYVSGPWPDVLVGRFPPLRQALQERGEEFVYTYCLDHDFPPPDRPVNSKFVILLRINGSVTARNFPKSEDHWRW